MKRGIACLGIAVLASACKSAPPTTAQSSAGAARGDGGAAATLGEISFEDAKKREQLSLAPTMVASDDGRVRLRVFANGIPSVKKSGEQAYELRVPVASGVESLLCFVSTAQPDAAESMTQILSNMAKFKNRELAEIDAGVISGGHPYLYTELSYVVEEGGQKRFGLLKSMVVPMQQHGIMCVHDEPGYRKTFRQVLESISESLEVKHADTIPPPRHHDVSVVTVGGKRLGFEEMLVMPRGGGGTVYMANSSRLMPRSAGEVVAHDEALAEDADRDGRLIFGNYVANSGKLYNLRIERGSGGRYHVSGKHKGKEVKIVLSPKTPLVGRAAQPALIARALLGPSGRSEVSFVNYEPEITPNELTTITIRKAEDASDLPFEITMGGRKIRAAFDEHGYPEKMLSREGTIEARADRVFQQGTLR